jgi:hypothetical protein
MAPTNTEPSNHKVLWSGGFLDGTLSIFTPRDSVTCTCEQDTDNLLPAGYTYILMYHMVSKDGTVEVDGHMHTTEMAVKLMVNTVIGLLKSAVEKHYLEQVMESKPNGLLQ